MTYYERFIIKTIVGLCLATVVFFAGWMGGCHYSKQHAKTEYRIDTIRVKPDTVIASSPVLTEEVPCFIPSEVDTSAILAKFYTKPLTVIAISEHVLSSEERGFATKVIAAHHLQVTVAHSAVGS